MEPTTIIGTIKWLFGKFNPFKVIQVFARWILRKELKAKDDENQHLKENIRQIEIDLKTKEIKIQESIANLNNPYYCHPCYEHMTKHDTYAECPQCKRRQNYPKKRQRTFSTPSELDKDY